MIPSTIPPKKVVQYRSIVGGITVGHGALLCPIDHPNVEDVENYELARTSCVLSYDAAAGRIETLNTVYVRAQLTTFTAFCRATNNIGTTWVGNVEAEFVEDAMEKAVAACAADWGTEDEPYENHITCIGIAKGDVEILHWEDIE